MDRCDLRSLVRGAAPGFVSDEDVEEFVGRVPSLRTETVPGAGHSVRSDEPLALARLIGDFVSSPSTGS